MLHLFVLIAWAINCNIHSIKHPDWWPASLDAEMLRNTQTASSSFPTPSFQTSGLSKTIHECPNIISEHIPARTHIQTESLCIIWREGQANWEAFVYMFPCTGILPVPLCVCLGSLLLSSPQHTLRAAVPAHYGGAGLLSWLCHVSSASLPDQLPLAAITNYH